MAKSDDEDLDRFLNILLALTIAAGAFTAFVILYPLFQ